MNSAVTTALSIVVLATSMIAQTERKPGNEEKRIGYFAGHWTVEVEVIPFPGWPSGKFNSSETCKMFAGSFQLVCHSEATTPWHTGVTKTQSILAYSPMGKTYTYYRISSLGEGYFWKGTASGDVWTWTNESNADGKLMKAQMTVTELSPTSYESKLEYSTDGGPWKVLTETKASKVQ